MDALEAILRCPVCRGKLEQNPEFKCESCGMGFKKTGRLPVLIDFEESIFTPDEYVSEVYTAGSEVSVARKQRGEGFRRAIRKLTFGGNEAAGRNAERFLGKLGVASGEPLVLVIGGGSIGAGLQSFYNKPGLKIIGVDVYPSPHIDLICDGHKLPFQDGCFDGVLIQAVLEHVLDPAKVVEEIYRVLKPGGCVYAETPFMQQVHERAYDFTRFTLGGHRWLFKKFEEIDAGSVSGPGVALLWSIHYYLKSLGAGGKLALVLTAPLFWLRFGDKTAKRGGKLDAACGLFFLGVKSTKVLQANELPDYYRRHHTSKARREP